MKTLRTPFLHQLATAGVGALLLSAVGLPAAAQTTAPVQPPAGTVPAATPSGPYSLQRAVDVALQNNLTVRQQQLTTENTNVVLRQSRAALLPTANAAASQSWNYGTNVDPLTFQFQNQTTRANNFSLSSQVTLFSGFQLRNTIKRNELDYQAGLSDIEKSRNDIALNVASSFLQLVLAQEIVRANEARVNTSQQQVSRAQKLLKAGSVAESNVLDSQAQLASDELNVITAQNQVAFYRLQLAQLLNLPSATGFEIEVPNLPDPDDVVMLTADPDGTYQTAQGIMPEVKAADLRVQSALRTVELARGAYYPRLTFGGSIFSGYSSARIGRKLTGDSTVVPSGFIYQLTPTGAQVVPGLFSGIKQPRFETLSEGFTSQVKNNLGKQLSFNLSIPILNGLQARTNVQRSEIGVKQNELRAEQTRLQLRQTIQQAYADAIAAQRRYAAAKRQTEALTTAYRNAEIRFNNGLLNGTDFNIAKNNLYGAESSMIQAKYEFIFRRKVLDFYEGRGIRL
ncbi:TolC family protein [Hymenobacter chitinivorans]|uniref:Outer membrane protein n=1 Tax=Hymenobacter chitinivorans DSM 11115 TaxID=1121954 RepID=A0A2M9BRD4_9BACT|nr:TolC family protein [Hymenobacter chitinivorans]PJJ60501.1 outer membrane protein [Hymenobacter chitinivorans DSM 11115]